MLSKYSWVIWLIFCLLIVACGDKNDSNTPDGTEKFYVPPPEDIELGEPTEPIINEGDCANFDLQLYMSRDGKLNKPLQLRVLRDEARVYSSAEALNSDGTLEFGIPLKDMEEVKNGRIKVRKEGEDELGWVSREDLLCTNRPIVDPDKGLEKKAYIKTGITEHKSGVSAFIYVYPMPKTQCNDKCRKLSLFSMYFIVDQEDEWLLLSEDYGITRPLVGWVRQSDVYIWDTAYGLRPKDDLIFQDKQGKGDATRCAYQSLSDAINRNKDKCMTIVAGKRWYQTKMRIPLLDIVDRYGRHIPPTTIADSNKGNYSAFYKVALSMAGVGVTRKLGNTIEITPTQFDENPLEEAFVSMKYIDVFFLIDGTDSMQPFIEMIRGKNGSPGIVQRIANTLRNDSDFKKAKLRFGFRIYRDSYAGEKNLGDGLPLRAENCNEITNQDMDENLQIFHNKIANVRTSYKDRGKDDYPENLFGGIKKALQDLRSCKEHTKLLFVIGDHGDKDDMKMMNLKRIVRQRKNDSNRWVTFFIQTPNNARNAKHPKFYQSAYKKYYNQGHDFLSEIFSGTKEDTENYFINLLAGNATSQMDCNQLNARTRLNVNLLDERILCGVKSFSKYGVIEELIVDLRGGAALEKAIEKLRNKHTDIPALFVDFIKQEGCETLGKQCKDRVYDISFEGYIPVTDDISLDVWMNASQILDWKQDILSIFEKGFNQFSLTEQREELERTIAENLTQRLRKPEMDANETYADYFQRQFGLPVRIRSPLLSYDPILFHDNSKIPKCEIDRLAVWATNVGKMLGIVYEGKFRPDYKHFPPPETTCPTASENGKRIPFIDGRIGKRPLGPDDTYSYSHDFRGKTIYWIPEEFLP
jgi:hypothetical protein